MSDVSQEGQEDQGPQQLPEVVGPLIVVSHTHEEKEGVYRIVLGHNVYRGDEIIRTEIYENDFVFSNEDPRWFTDRGLRRPLDVIASEQRIIVKSTLEEQERQREADARVRAESITPLPGMGEEL